MSSNRTYTPAEVCEMFGISKSTLLRWEREGNLAGVGRDLNKNRRYTQENIRVIREQQLKKQYENASERGDNAALKTLHEQLSLGKLSDGDVNGLRELTNLEHLSPDTIMRMLRIALDEYEPRDPVFRQIVKAAADSCSKSEK